MPLSAVLFLSLTHLAIGIVGTLALVGRDAGIKFFRFNAGLASILFAIALGFRPETLGPAAGAGRFALAAIVASTASIVVYWATLGRVWSGAREWLLGAAILFGTAGLVSQAVALADGGPPGAAAITVASFLTSAALLGGSCTALILGHWYLVLPSMDVARLRSIVAFHIGSAVSRTVIAGIAVLLALTVWADPLPVNFQRYATSVDGVFLWMRVLFGLAGPLVLSYLTWETAKINATQSATGILYVDFFAVLVGEVLAKYVLLATRVPV